MARIKAFIGHSFNDEDSAVVATFCKYFSSIRDIGFEWDHAERAEVKELANKVKQKMEGKDLFIGIFTKKNKQIIPEKLTPYFWNRKKLIALSNEYSWTTSDWIIQESGYALGKGMRVIFLVEGGIGCVGGLQGDLEYIPFNRNNIPECFPKLIEMITSLMPTEAAAMLKETVAISSEEIEEKSETEDERGGVTSFRKLYQAIVANDIETEKTALGELLENDPDEYEKVKTKGLYLWMRHKHGNKDILSDLIKLSDENPRHPDPHSWLGNLYEEYKQFDKAHDQLIKASELTEIAIEKTIYICRAAKALIEEGRLKEAKEHIITRINSVGRDSTEELFELYNTLALIQKRSSNTERYLSLAEKALELKPSDSSTRFDLAYTYSENKNHIMALYHYNILSNSAPDLANLNNLGVELSKLGLPGKAINAYLRSKELGGSTAMGNLASKLISVGFFDEARKYLQEALKHEDHPINVGEALGKLEKSIEEENEKEKKLFSDISPRIRFRVRYAGAYTSKTDDYLLQGKWKTRHGDVTIIINGNQFIASGQFERPQQGLALVYSKNILGGAVKSEIIKVHYEGVIINRAIDYKLSVSARPAGEPSKTTKASTLLGKIDDTEYAFNYTGQMIGSEDRNKIEVMETDDKGNVTFYDITPAEEG